MSVTQSQWTEHVKVHTAIASVCLTLLSAKKPLAKYVA